MMQRLVTGRIVWAEIADANGVPKLRPAVIVTPSDQLTQTKPFDVVAVTSRLTDPIPDDHVVLPWHPQGHPRTGLKRRCAAVCTWLALIRDTDIRDVAGIVPAPLMRTILGKVRAASKPPAAPPLSAAKSTGAMPAPGPTAPPPPAQEDPGPQLSDGAS